MKTLDEKLTGITTDHHTETQQSISRAEGNIAKRITEDGSETRKLLQSFEEKLTGNTYKIASLSIPDEGYFFQNVRWMHRFILKK